MAALGATTALGSAAALGALLGLAALSGDLNSNIAFSLLGTLDLFFDLSEFAEGSGSLHCCC
jgi:hypothetical protein